MLESFRVLTIDECCLPDTFVTVGNWVTHKRRRETIIQLSLLAAIGLLIMNCGKNPMNTYIACIIHDNAVFVQLHVLVINTETWVRLSPYCGYLLNRRTIHFYEPRALNWPQNQVGKKIDLSVSMYEIVNNELKLRQRTYEYYFALTSAFLSPNLANFCLQKVQLLPNKWNLNSAYFLLVHTKLLNPFTAPSHYKYM